MTNHEELRRLATEANVTTSHVGATQEIWDAINVDLQQILYDVSCWEGRHAERMCERLETAIKRLNAAVVNEREGYETAIAVGYENDALRTRLVEVEKDAGRYQWMRSAKTDVALVIDKVSGFIPPDEHVPGVGGYHTYEYRSGEELDMAIDSAIGAQA